MVIGLVAGGAAVAVLAMTQPEVRTWPTRVPSEGPTLPPPSWIAAAPGDDEGVPAGLYERLEEVRLEQVPLEEALQVLQERYGLSVSAGWQSLELEGVDPRTPISLDARGLKMADALNQLLSVLRVNLGVNLAWYLEGDRIVVVARDAMPHSAFSTRVYDVRDIMFNAARADPDVDGEAFLAIVTTGATPGQWNDSWTSNRRGRASAVYFGGRIIVHHDAWGHAEVARLIESLRESMSRSAPGTEEAK